MSVEFADGKFKAQCHDISLTNVGNPQFIVRGPGEIWQDEHGQLKFKIFINSQAYRALQRYMARPGIIGQVIPVTDCFELHAIEHILPRWAASHILPYPRGGIDQGLAHGFIHQLVQTQVVPTNGNQDWVGLRFKNKLDFPSNQNTLTVIRVAGEERSFSSNFNVAIFNQDGYEFEVRHESEHTLVSLRMPAGTLTTATPFRIQEALQFVLGLELTLLVIETASGGKYTTRLVSPRTHRRNGQMNPPLQFRELEQRGNFWRMFGDYFRYVHSNPQSGWHPISKHIASAIEATAASLDTEVLALSVAVEGMIGECFPDIAPVKAESLAEIGLVENAVTALRLTDTMRRRLEGTIGQLRKPRNSDLLRVFIENWRLPNVLFQSWRTLRNSSAHGQGQTGGEFETTLKLMDDVRSLLYSIVLARINYAGPYTDYAAQNWPLRHWPIPAPVGPPPIQPAL